jgi:hypothetical protein
MKTIPNMRKPLYAAVLLFFLAPAGLFAFDPWVLVCPLGAGFTVSMPGAPQQTPPGSAQWIFRDPQNRFYSAAYQDKQPGTGKGAPALKDNMEAVLKASNARLLEKKFFALKRFPACEFKLQTGTGQIAVSLLVMVNLRIYALGIVSSSRNYDEAIRRKFFDSFQLVSTKLNPAK